MALTNTESVSKHKVQFSLAEKIKDTLYTVLVAKCLVTWYGHSYLSAATCYKLDGAGVLLPSAAQSALSFKFDTTSGLITQWVHDVFKTCLNWANFLCLFHCSLTVTTVVKLRVLPFSGRSESWERQLSRLTSPAVVRRLSPHCPRFPRPVTDVAASLSGITNHCTLGN